MQKDYACRQDGQLCRRTVHVGSYECINSDWYMPGDHRFPRPSSPTGFLGLV
ncbi:hypothetical protein WN51_12558 [Melipona quadrifasciata]|uniref:Uncharacterized protein n=1 Tax=Melipona quadrifasciata TaxID=166423 RepID=A0A0M9A271_9HYME|nr:hypothetical protein WN51_12558 [Melipona quadrifasciata]